MKKIISLSLIMICYYALHAQTYPVTFDNLNLPIQENVWRGKDQKGGFSSNGFVFRNTYDAGWDYWTGASYCNIKDDTSEGFTNQFASYALGGINKTEQYATLTGNAWIILEKPAKINGMFISNSTYTALSIKNGDAFAKKFGGVDGNDKDYFKLKAFGMYNGIKVDSAEMMLADYTASDNAKDYILKDWSWLDLSQWPIIDSIGFDYESSDTGKYGINTPKYFCVDDINGASPESFIHYEDFENFALDSTGYWNGSNLSGGFLISNMYFENNNNLSLNTWNGWSVSNHTDRNTAGWTNEFSVISGSGMSNSKNYLVGKDRAIIRMPYNQGLSTIDVGTSIMVNNTTYAYYSMKEGVAPSKKFGGTSGNDPDYFKLLIQGFDKNGNYVDSVEFFLADYRFSDNNNDYVVKDWQQVDISNLVLKSAIRLEFSLSSSDNGALGMNTPAYFCMDDAIQLFGGNVKKQESAQIQVYPNPASNFLNIKLKGNASLAISDLQGKTFLNSNYDGINGIDISQLNTGIYLVTIQQNGKMYHAKFVKQ